MHAPTDEAGPSMLQNNGLLHAGSAAARQREAARWISSRGLASQVLVVTPTIEAGSRLLRRAAEGRAAAFGWQRVTLTELAARLAATRLAAEGLAQSTGVVLEAMCARMVHLAREDGSLGRYARVADRPGLPRALARTFAEVSLADVDGAALPPDLARLYAAHRRELSRAGLADRGDVLRAAIARVADASSHPLLDLPTLLVDVPLAHALEAELVRALASRGANGRGGEVRAVVPSGDASTLRRLSSALQASPEPLPVPDGDRALDRLRQQLFAEIRASGPMDGSVELFSAPGESRECVEIARRVLEAADAGVPFDRMAVLTHAPERYRAHLVEALRRAQIPACFSRGTVRPDPTGRALLALLACREERLSARAFAEYLSLGVVPDAAEDGAPPTAADAAWLPPEDEAIPLPADEERLREDDSEERDDEQGEAAWDPEAPVVRGTLRAPWRWERLLVDAAVIGGADRWRRRLDGLERALGEREEGLDDPEAPAAASVRRQRRDLAHLRAFALPLLERLEALPEQATWGEWVGRLEALAACAIRRPERVLAVLRELSPMAPIGPVGLTEVHLVLSRRLAEMVERPGSATAGKLYVAFTREARGLSFSRVFVPGLAEKIFPKKVSEDPIALDAVRVALGGDARSELETNEDRVAHERLALRLAIGAAEDAVILSYPRLDTERGRPRVPSFYGLEVVRAVEGALPSFEQLAARAEDAGKARMAWPAPEAPERAIDAAEYDLAVLHALLAEEDPKAVVGAASYLVQANPHLGRALRARYAKWEGKWSKSDGLVNASDEARAALAKHLPSARAFSATALEQLAACPYRFYLRTVLRLEPREAPEAIEALDPATRGRFIHEVQFRCLGRLRAGGMLPLTEEKLEAARAVLEDVIEAVEARFVEELAPAIPRVWTDAVSDLRSDLAEWLVRAAERPDWVPIGFELGFGLPLTDERDPASREEPVELSEGLRLRGAIDLVEQRDGVLRATDHKTGAARAVHGVIEGGRTLQPVLYARALEELYPGRTVGGGRLYWCTAKGRFEERSVPLDDRARRALTVLVETVQHAFEEGFFPALPEDKACERCDYLAVCGPKEAMRTGRKARGHRYLGPLKKLRKQP